MTRIILAALVALPFVPKSAHAAEGYFVPGEVIIKVRGGATLQTVAQISTDANAEGDDHLADIGDTQLRRLRVRGTTADAIRNLSSNSWVEYAEPNYIFHANVAPNDSRYGELWGMNNTGQVVNGVSGLPRDDISAQQAWSITTGSPNVIVGVVDTGVDYMHPDLAANIWSNPTGVGNCPVGTHGYNSIAQTCDPMDDAVNNYSHGTHVSGTIGAVGNNSLGVVGVNWTVKIMGLKGLDSNGGGTAATTIPAIDFAVQAKIAGQNVRVLNASWGGPIFSQALIDEINHANANDILFVAAAGEGQNGGPGVNQDVTPSYPSSLNTPNMVAVAATDNNDGLASFSNWGANTVSLGAPGVGILSLQRLGQYYSLNGTSMAAPHVAGAAALLLAAQPALNTAGLKSALLNNVDQVSTLIGRTVSGGRLNVARAMGCGFPVSASPASATGRSVSYTVTVSSANGCSDPVTVRFNPIAQPWPPGMTVNYAYPGGARGTTELAVLPGGSVVVTFIRSTGPADTYTPQLQGVAHNLYSSTTVTWTAVCGFTSLCTGGKIWDDASCMCTF